MQIKISETLKKTTSYLISESLIRNIVLFSGGIILFIGGVIVYGILLNIKEPKLRDAMLSKGYEEITKPNILIDRSKFHLHLYQDTVLIKTYRASFGRNTSIPKKSATDNATPVGEYKICRIDTTHRYYKFFRLNYPNTNDAMEALRKGIISQSEFDRLRFELLYEECPELATTLGGNIGIHGIGEYNSFFKNLPFVFNWTDGSIALSNEDIDELYSIVTKGTNVVIK
jgi:murein L,D-transpeptidase YafK